MNFNEFRKHIEAGGGFIMIHGPTEEESQSARYLLADIDFHITPNSLTELLLRFVAESRTMLDGFTLDTSGPGFKIRIAPVPKVKPAKKAKR
jgi:hypothetical protein